MHEKVKIEYKSQAEAKWVTVKSLARIEIGGIAVVVWMRQTQNKKRIFSELVIVSIDLTESLLWFGHIK